jgi:dienelactone hydrolase
MRLTAPPVLAAALILALAGASPSIARNDDALWKQAEQNARVAQDAINRSERVVRGWYEQRGTNNYLIPQNLKSRRWTAENSAADLWSFFVQTALVTESAELDDLVRKTLRDEIRLTTRLDRLPDHYDIDANRFVFDGIDIGRVIFGSSEYVKDGLLPIVEFGGRTVWFDRARGMLEDIFKNAPIETKFGPLPAEGAEVNGEMLQNLCRFYFATGDERFKKWAERIGDAYFLDMMPKNNDLPCHSWDFAAGKPRRDVLSLNDHGNEIVAGLSELLMLEHHCDPAKEQQYLPPMKRMVDKLLNIAVNDDGLWFQSIKPSTGEISGRGTPDTWGYALNGVYTLYMITGEQRYRAAVERALRGINRDGKYDDWGGADSFADSIESGILLYNRIREPKTLAWIDRITPEFLGIQRDDGIVEGWHGDGNYVRTALMFALMKTAGTRAVPWRSDLRIGAVEREGVLRALVASDQPWIGRVKFDEPRHRTHMNLPENCPRLNEFPEWFVVEPDQLYEVEIDGQPQPPLLGDDLIAGLPIELSGQPVKILARPVGPAPYGDQRVAIAAQGIILGAGPFRIPIRITNGTRQRKHLTLKSSRGTLSSADFEVAAGGDASVQLSGVAESSGTVVIEAYDAASTLLGTCSIRVVFGKSLVGFAEFHTEQFAGHGYRWCGRSPIEATLTARPNADHVLQLLWGAKNDERSAVVQINGRDFAVRHGGYQGYEWIEVRVPADLVKQDKISVTVRPDPAHGVPAFISEMRLRAVNGDNGGTAARPLLPPRDTRFSSVHHTATPFAMPPIVSADDWRDHAVWLRQRILTAAGLWPWPEQTPLNAEIFDVSQHDGYSVAKVHFESFPGFRVTGNLYRPIDDVERHPAVLCPHGHWEHGRLENDEVCSVPGRCIDLARQGYVVFSYDMIGFIDSRQIPHKLRNQRAELWGVNILGLQLLNSIRAVDFLSGLSDVDEERIGCTGASGGGTQTFLLSAVDPRIACAAPVNMVSATFQGGCICENAANLRIDAFNVEFAAAIAPRPLLLVSASGDWTANTPQCEYPMIAAVYEILGARDMLAQQQMKSEHNYNADSRAVVYDWFARHLSPPRPDAPRTGTHLDLDIDDDLRLFPADEDPPISPHGAARLVESRIEAAKRMIDTLKPVSAADVPHVRETLGVALRHCLNVNTPDAADVLVEPVGAPRPVKRGSGRQMLIGRAGVGDRIPATLYVPDGKRSGCTLVIHENGRRSLLRGKTGQPGPLVEQLVGAGHTVLTIDAYDTGDTTLTDDERAECDLLLFGETFNRTALCNRVQDILTAMAYLANEWDSDRVNVAGAGDAGLWALLARSQTDLPGRTVVDANRIAYDDDDLINERFRSGGFRRAGDFRTAIALCAPRPLLLHNCAADFPADWGAGAYGRGPQSDRFRAQTAEAGVEQMVEWLTR